MREFQDSQNAVETSPAARTKKTLWVISDLYYPETNQTGYYMTLIAEGLTQDFDVKAICGQPHYQVRGVRAAKRETRNGVEIFRVWGTTLDKNVLPFRLLNMLTLCSSMFFHTVFKVNSHTPILVVSSPPTLLYVIALAAKIRRAEYHAIVQDKYPEILVSLGKTKADSLFVKSLARLNRWMYRGAKTVIAVGRDMKRLIDEQMGVRRPEQSNTRVIQNWAALEEIEPQPRDENQLLEELNLKDKFVFLYAGNMGHAQDLESIVECANRLKNDERFHFLFIGSGVKRKWLEREASENDLSNVTILAPRPRSEQKVFLNACDIGLVPLVERMSGMAMPSRTYNFLAAAKPVLALTDADSELATVIGEDQVGWHVPPRRPDALLETIHKIYQSRDRLDAMGERARKSALEKYSTEVAVEKFRRVLIGD